MAVSGKRHLFLTGGRGAGKTTLLKALLPLLCPEPVPGVCTRAIPGDGVDLAEVPSGRVTRVGVFDPALPGPENRMRPVPGGFSGAGVEALDACMESPCPWAFVDEVGYLESQDTAYRDALLRLLDKKRVAAVLRSQNLPFLNELKARPDACLVDLDRPFGNTGCVIMASGLGRRFGGGKLLAELDGRTLLDRVLDATEQGFSRRVVVTRDAGVEALCLARGVPCLRHSLPLRSDTVRLGLEFLTKDSPLDACAFFPGDQPLVRSQTVHALLLAAAGEPGAIWRLGYGQQAGAPVVFPRTLFGELRALPAGRGGGAVAAAHPELVRVLPALSPAELRDVDTPADLAELEGLLRQNPLP
ncbi:NTP transferase domain-containing protein [Subdoligranulum sp. DSM 109015]|uniref:NTP transferase domain-containing protein n=1 Tax=Gemmiger gallinarum TaxID=2779354 RepID=A0ABR9R6U9_9FIRM|nr:NTP transferase domain-containing protein [Gemmiger gallinarum]